MRDVVINMQNVTVSYREDVALQNLSIEIKNGEMIGIAGPNGAGKTTILTVVNGLGRLVRGQAKVLGHLMSAGKKGRDFRLCYKTASLRKLIGYVPQGCSVDPGTPISVRDAVMLGRYGRLGFWRRPGRDDWQVVGKLLEMVEISHLAERPFGHLSGGEQQRVAIARALAQEPRIMLLDEPTTYLDWRSRQEILQLIKQVHREKGLTTLMVTHDPKDTFNFCDRVVLLQQGRVAAIGPPAKTLSDAVLRKVYGESTICCQGGFY
ncbi:ABC transporter ATP-binding protein [Desulfotruncus alcoholivorax]|uniref:ABC transporter ATP-binding protein n=1 Tax=Desulfotruncus alcoholivorax TaxID=265477 RepID=UPI0003FBFF1C|nr:ABC transporter ATP-binding protein [Desulfotruncus alcoholivorax]